MYQMWDEISQKTYLSVQKTKLSNLTKNEIVLPPKHGAPPTRVDPTPPGEIGLTAFIIIFVKFQKLS